MSKYILCETEMKNEQCLKEALVEVGVEPRHIETHENPVELRGFPGELSPRAHIVIRGGTSRGSEAYSGSDIGFERGPGGKYKAWVNDYDVRSSLGSKIMNNELVQAYVLRKVQQEVAGKCWEITSKTEEKDKSIRLRLRT